jgi:hypothetical protein
MANPPSTLTHHTESEENEMEISFHDVRNITAVSSYGETATWVDLEITERNKYSGKVTKTTVAFFTVEKDPILCAKLAQAINQCFAAQETPNEVA